MRGGLRQASSVARHRFGLEYWDRDAEVWSNLKLPIEEGVNVIGRDSFRSVAENVQSLAAEHLRITLKGDQIFAEEGETLNGVYLRIAAGQSIELKPNHRYLIGRHVFRFEPSVPPVSDETVISGDGELLLWRRLEPQAYLVFLGPDDEAGVRFPLTRGLARGDETIIGRSGKPKENVRSADIMLDGDVETSRSHARVYKRDDRFFLEDIGSSNGTFVRFKGQMAIRPGQARDPESGDHLQIGPVVVRLIES